MRGKAWTSGRRCAGAGQGRGGGGSAVAGSTRWATTNTRGGVSGLLALAFGRTGPPCNVTTTPRQRRTHEERHSRREVEFDAAPQRHGPAGGSWLRLMPNPARGRLQWPAPAVGCRLLSHLQNPTPPAPVGGALSHACPAVRSQRPPGLQPLLPTLPVPLTVQNTHAFHHTPGPCPACRSACLPCPRSRVCQPACGTDVQACQVQQHMVCAPGAHTHRQAGSSSGPNRVLCLHCLPFHGGRPSACKRCTCPCPRRPGLWRHVLVCVKKHAHTHTHDVEAAGPAASSRPPPPPVVADGRACTTRPHPT